MLILVLSALGLVWFINTPFFVEWSHIMVVGGQVSISVTTLICLGYVAVGIFGICRWYYSRRL